MTTAVDAMMSALARASVFIWFSLFLITTRQVVSVKSPSPLPKITTKNKPLTVKIKEMRTFSKIHKKRKHGYKNERNEDIFQNRKA